MAVSGPSHAVCRILVLKAWDLQSGRKVNIGSLTSCHQSAACNFGPSQLFVETVPTRCFISPKEVLAGRIAEADRFPQRNLEGS